MTLKRTISQARASSRAALSHRNIQAVGGFHHEDVQTIADEVVRDYLDALRTDEFLAARILDRVDLQWPRNPHDQVSLVLRMILPDNA